MVNENTASSYLDNPDVFKILVATDIHLGYDENNPISGKFAALFNFQRISQCEN
jgi:hypothetical protein